MVSEKANDSRRRSHVLSSRAVWHQHAPSLWRRHKSVSQVAGGDHENKYRCEHIPVARYCSGVVWHACLGSVMLFGYTRVHHGIGQKQENRPLHEPRLELEQHRDRHRSGDLSMFAYE